MQSNSCYLFIYLFCSCHASGLLPSGYPFGTFIHREQRKQALANPSRTDVDAKLALKDENSPHLVVDVIQVVEAIYRPPVSRLLFPRAESSKGESESFFPFPTQEGSPPRDTPDSYNIL